MAAELMKKWFCKCGNAITLEQLQAHKLCDSCEATKARLKNTVEIPRSMLPEKPAVPNAPGGFGDDPDRARFHDALKEFRPPSATPYAEIGGEQIDLSKFGYDNTDRLLYAMSTIPPGEEIIERLEVVEGGFIVADRQKLVDGELVIVGREQLAGEDSKLDKKAYEAEQEKWRR